MPETLGSLSKELKWQKIWKLCSRTSKTESIYDLGVHLCGLLLETEIGSNLICIFAFKLCLFENFSLPEKPLFKCEMLPQKPILANEAEKKGEKLCSPIAPIFAGCLEQVHFRGTLE